MLEHFVGLLFVCLSNQWFGGQINFVLYVIENTAKNLKLVDERKKFTFSSIKISMVKIGSKDGGYR